MNPIKPTLLAALIGLLCGSVGTWVGLNFTSKPMPVQIPKSVGSTGTMKINYIPYQIETLTAVTTSHMNDERIPPILLNDPKAIAKILQQIHQSPTSPSIQLSDGRIRAKITYGDVVYFIDAEGNCLSSRFESHKISWSILSALFPSAT